MGEEAMTLADDLRAAAAVIDEHVSMFALTSRSSATRLRAHADTIEQVEREMRAAIRNGQHFVDPTEWANALRGDSNGK